MNRKGGNAETLNPRIEWSIQRMTAFLQRVGIDPDTGERIVTDTPEPVHPMIDPLDYVPTPDLALEEMEDR